MRTSIELIGTLLTRFVLSCSELTRCPFLRRVHAQTLSQNPECLHVLRRDDISQPHALLSSCTPSCINALWLAESLLILWDLLTEPREQKSNGHRKCYQDIIFLLQLPSAPLFLLSQSASYPRSSSAFASRFSMYCVLMLPFRGAGHSPPCPFVAAARCSAFTPLL